MVQDRVIGVWWDAFRVLEDFAISVVKLHRDFTQEMESLQVPEAEAEGGLKRAVKIAAITNTFQSRLEYLAPAIRGAYQGLESLLPKDMSDLGENDYRIVAVMRGLRPIMDRLPSANL